MLQHYFHLYTKWVLILVVSVIPLTSFAQVLGLELLNNKEELEIEFEYRQGFIILDIRLGNTLPLKFILDTGAEHIILFKREISDIMGFEYEKRINLIGSDLNQEVFALICRNIPIELKKCKTVERDIIVLEEDFLHLEELTGETIHGILGSRFFRGLAVKIDYKKQKLKLYNAAKFKPLAWENFNAYDIVIDRHKPYIKSTVITDEGLNIPVNLLIDTGAALPFLLFNNSHPSLKVPEKFVKGNLGKGIGGDLEGYLSRVRKLSLTDDLNFDNIITSFQDLSQDVNAEVYNYRNGLIGNPILERFTVIFDFVKSKLYLKPRKKYNKAFKYDKSGLTIYAFGSKLDQYFIKSVVKDSPAWEAGIREGDLIKRLGLLPANYYSLGGIVKRLQKKNGKKIKMKLERNGVPYKTSFRLRDILE